MTTEWPIQSYTQQRERLSALYDLALELSALRDLPAVLNTALSHCLELTQSEFGFVGLSSDDGKLLDIVAIQGFHPAAEFFQEQHLIPLRPSLFALAILENRPVRSDNAMLEQRYGQPHGHPAVHTFLGVPLRVREQPIGMLGLANRPTPYAQDHEHLLMTYAAQVAIAIQNARLNEQLQRANAELEERVEARTSELKETRDDLAEKAIQLKRLWADTVSIQEHDRQRISQGLHDSLNQLLVGAMLELKAGRDRLTREDGAGAQDHFQRSSDVLHHIEGDLRQVIFDLRPPTLDSLGLLSSLTRYVHQYTRATGLACQVIHEGEPYRLPTDAEITLYRIVQEALQNAANHSRASAVIVQMYFDAQYLCLFVNDDGCGFDLAKCESDPGCHFGLLGMRERAEGIGAKFLIKTAPNCGTQVQVWVPVVAGSA